MKQVFDNYRLTFVIFLILTLSGITFGQDLGSTSGLFRSKTTTKKSSTTTTKKASTAKKKTAPKKKAPVRSSKSKSVTKSPAKPTTNNDTSNSASAENDSETVSNESAKIATNRVRKLDSDVIITIGNKSTAGSVEMFEIAIGEGNAARNRRLYVQAEEAYLRARKLVPEDSRAIYGLGNIFSDQQRWEEAEVAYRQAVAIEPDNPYANIALSYVLTQPVVGTNVGERYAQAEEIARKAIALDPNNAIGFDQLGVALELRGIISTETQEAYEKALALDPTFALAHAHMGRLMRKRGRTSESSAAYREAIRLSVNVPTMIQVADVMQSQQRYLDSEHLLREALRRDPRNPTGLYLLGRALITRKSFDEAETVLREAVAVSSKSFVSYALLASLYSQSGDLPKAEKTLNQAHEFVSENEKMRLAQEFELVGDGYVKARRNDDAARVYRTAITLDGKKTSLAVKLATAESRK